jgi:F5/8 type C domain
VAGATPAGTEAEWTFFRLPKTVEPREKEPRSPSSPTDRCNQTIPVRGVVAPPAVTDSGPLFDGDPESGWISRREQHAGDAMTITLNRAARTCSISLLLGNGPDAYPGAVAIDLSMDGDEWQIIFEGKTAGLALAGALRDPRYSPLVFHWAATEARLIRIRLLHSHPIYPWAIREIVVAAER